MRILVLSPIVPYPPNSGFAIRVFQMATLLARGHDVTVLAYADEDVAEPARALANRGVAIRTVPRPALARARRSAQLATLLFPTSYTRLCHSSSAMQQSIDEFTESSVCDVVFVESTPMGGYRFPPRTTVVLTEHDIVYELLYRIYKTERSPARRLYNRIEYQKVKTHERALWRAVDGCVATSDREVPLIREHAPTTPIAVGPNGVDVEYFAPAAGEVDPRMIVMTGYMKTRPNVDGALFFVNEVLPRIHATRPDVTLYLVGGSPPDELMRCAGPRVVVTGEVPDVRPYIGRGAVFVVPLRMGGGTRLKVLEALSMEKPLVSTSIGCEGINVQDGEHLLIADDAADFADRVLDLLAAPEQGARLARAGRSLVERQYQWRAVVSTIEAFATDLVERKRKGPLR